MSAMATWIRPSQRAADGVAESLRTAGDDSDFVFQRKIHFAPNSFSTPLRRFCPLTVVDDFATPGGPCRSR